MFKRVARLIAAFLFCLFRCLLFVLLLQYSIASLRFYGDFFMLPSAVGVGNCESKRTAGNSSVLWRLKFTNLS